MEQLHESMAEFDNVIGKIVKDYESTKKKADRLGINIDSLYWNEEVKSYTIKKE